MNDKSDTLGVRLSEMIMAERPGAGRNVEETIKTAIMLANLTGSILAITLIQQPAIFQEVLTRLRNLMEEAATDVAKRAVERIKEEETQH